MFSTLFTGYALAHFAIAMSLVVLLIKRGYVPGAIFVAFTSFALTFDNGMIAWGAKIGPGDLLLSMSLPRFYMHAAFTPFLMFVAWMIAERAGLAFTRRRSLYFAMWLLVLGMSAWGIYADLAGGLELQVACLGDTLRYTTSAPPPQFCSPDQVSLPSHGPPIPSIAVVVVGTIIGALLWRAAGWPWLTLASVFMFFASGAPKANLGPTIGNLGEIVLQAAFAATLWRFSRPRSNG
jgi:hypothetical protein